MNIKETLFTLSNAVAIGDITDAADCAYDILSEYTDCTRDGKLTVIGRLSGKSDRTIMLDAHIDEVGFIVTDIDDNGFLTVKNCGGIDFRALDARTVTVHGKQKVTGVFCSIPPHLSSGEKNYNDISELKIDSLLGENAKDVISVGDFVTFCQAPLSLLGTRVSGKSFDDRAGVVCLLELAERLSKKELPVNVVFALTDMEELGTRGAKTAAYSISPDEAIVVDVSFADAPDVPKSDCGSLGQGAMIGISPVLDSGISKIMLDIAKSKNIPYQLEVMSGRTGTNGDVISLNKNGVKTGLLSIPLRNMHSDVEIIDTADISAVCDIIEQYILGGAAV